MRVDHTAKLPPLPLALRCLGEQIVILRKYYSPQLLRAIQECRIIKLACSILVSRKHVHPA